MTFIVLISYFKDIIDFTSDCLPVVFVLCLKFPLLFENYLYFICIAFKAFCNWLKEIGNVENPSGRI